MNTHRTRCLLAGTFVACSLITSLVMPAAEVRPARLDDSPVPAYTLPDPLRCDDGAAVIDSAAWETKRRPQLLRAFAEHVYGAMPASAGSATLSLEVTSVEGDALGGLATRKQITAWFTNDRSGPAMRILLYVPNSGRGKPRPLFFGLNFYGNHTVHPDPGIALAEGWVPESPGVVEHRATDAARGTDAAKWQIETVLARGYATATVYCGDLCPDRSDGLSEGVNGWFARSSTESRAPGDWGAIGVWAWGLRRALDVLARDEDIDSTRVAVHGHSRLGKTALWAGAQDARFALVISNESGCGGAALSKRIHGETVARINTVFPHWFAKNFRDYNDNEAKLPVDQHALLALVAPRALYVASAEGDAWADPRGEFLSVKGAEPVYRLYGFAGLGVDDVPPVHRVVGGTLRYHIRAGAHDMTAWDWSAFLDAADQYLR